MKSTIPRVVPWATNQEFQQVFEWLYSDIDQHADLVQRGVDHVKAWICRGRIPISVKSTMDMVELQLRDRKQQQQQGNTNSNSLSQNELRLLYGSALTRFVNITEDSLQTGYYAKSMYDIAEEIGLPLHFVQLRHAATHEDLPSLFMLRQASEVALRWLYDSYWSIQMHMDSSVEVNDETIQVISDAINIYKERRKAGLKSGAQDSGQKSIRKLIELLSQDTIQDTVVVLLLKVGGMVPTAKRKRSSLENMTVPDDLIQLWLPLLQELDATFPNFATELITAMVDRIDTGSGFALDQALVQVDSAPYTEIDQQESEKFKQASYLLTLTCWLRYFAAQCSLEEKLFEKNVRDDILEACLRKPNTYTRSVLQSIMKSDPVLGNSIAPFILYIDNAINASAELSDTTTTSNKKIDNMDTLMKEEVNDLADELQNLRKKLGVTEYTDPMNTDSDTVPSGWVLHDKDTWAPCPIGCLPNGKIPRLDLVVDDSAMVLD